MSSTLRSPSRSGFHSRAQSPNGTLRGASPIRLGSSHGGLNSTQNSSSYLRSPPDTSRRLTSEEIAKACDRMSKPKEDPSSGLGPLHKPHLIPKSQLDTSVERMYRQAMDTRDRNISNARQRRDDAEAPKMAKITSEELDESVARLYTQAVDRKQRRHEALSDRYLFKLPPIAQTMAEARSLGSPKRAVAAASRPASPDGGDDAAGRRSPSRAELVDRLYTKELASIEQRREERYKKYVSPTEPKMHMTDADGIAEIVERLYAGKK